MWLKMLWKSVSQPRFWNWGIDRQIRWIVTISSGQPRNVTFSHSTIYIFVEDYFFCPGPRKNYLIILCSARALRLHVALSHNDITYRIALVDGTNVSSKQRLVLGRLSTIFVRSNELWRWEQIVSCESVQDLSSCPDKQMPTLSLTRVLLSSTIQKRWLSKLLILPGRNTQK